MKFKSIIFFKEISVSTQIRKNTEVTLSNSQISFKFKNQIHTFNLGLLSFKLGGIDNKYLYISINKVNNISLVIEQGTQFLKKLKSLNYNSNISSNTIALLKQKKIQIFYRYAFRSVITLCTILIILLFSGLGIKHIIPFIPYSVDKKIGELALKPSIKHISQGSKVIDNKYSQTLIKKFQNIFFEKYKSQFKYDFYIISSPVENAFALPGGKIVILTGLIQATTSVEEILAVLSHEIAHIEKRHGVQRALKGLGTFFFLQLLFQNWDAVAQIIIQNIVILNELGFSREMETEADIFGIELMNKIHISPHFLISFFEKMYKKEKQLTNKSSETFNLEWLSSHPLTKKRIQLIKETMITKKLHQKKYKTIHHINWNYFKKKLK